MSDPAIVPSAGQLPASGLRTPPTLFLDAGEKAWFRFLEYFTAHIRNPNTRAADARAVSQSSRRCEQRQVRLGQRSPFPAAAYRGEVAQRPPNRAVKQPPAALR